MARESDVYFRAAWDWPREAASRDLSTPLAIKKWAAKSVILIWHRCRAWDHDDIELMRCSPHYNGVNFEAGHNSLVLLRKTIIEAMKAIESPCESPSKNGESWEEEYEIVREFIRSIGRKPKPPALPVAAPVAGATSDRMLTTHERNDLLLEWQNKGMKPASIRDKWNTEHPSQILSNGDKSQGRDTVKKCIEEAVDRQGKCNGNETNS